LEVGLFNRVGSLHVGQFLWIKRCDCIFLVFLFLDITEEIIKPVADDIRGDVIYFLQSVTQHNLNILVFEIGFQIFFEFEGKVKFPSYEPFYFLSIRFENVLSQAIQSKVCISGHTASFMVPDVFN